MLDLNATSPGLRTAVASLIAPDRITVVAFFLWAWSAFDAFAFHAERKTRSLYSGTYRGKRRHLCRLSYAFQRLGHAFPVLRPLVVALRWLQILKLIGHPIPGCAQWGVPRRLPLRHRAS